MKQGAPYNPPVGDGLTDRARNLLTGNPLRWAVLHEVRPYSGGERRRTTENGGERRRTTENGGERRKTVETAENGGVVG